MSSRTTKDLAPQKWRARNRTRDDDHERGRFIGVGITNYTGGYSTLPWAREDVELVATALGADFEPCLLLDPTEQQIRDQFSSIRQAGPVNGPVVMLWSGHGVLPRAGDLRLLAADSGRHQAAGLSAGEVALSLASLGASQILLILDVCKAGGAMLSTLEAGMCLPNAGQTPLQTWFGLLAASQREEVAFDGLFARHLLRLLKQGPSDPDLRRWRWSTQSARISGYDLIDAVLKEWNDVSQTPVQANIGSSYFMLRNPRFDPGPPALADKAVEAGAQDWFTGRSSAVAEVKGWLGSAQPGLRVVAGAAGTGKTAVVEQVWRGHDEGGAVWVSARGLTPDRLEGLLASDRSSTSEEAVGIVVVDGLDAAGLSAAPIARALAILARNAIVIVTTRAAAELMQWLQPAEILMLDHWSAQTEEDLRDYVTARLAGISPVMSPAVVADHLAGLIKGAAEPLPTFLLARLVTDQLRVSPADTSQAGWAAELHPSVQSALLADLDRLDAPRGRTLPPGVTPAGLARHLLACLSWCLGAGFPEDEWIAVANACGPVSVDRHDIAWVLEQLGRYVVQDGDDGVSVYRLADPSLMTAVRQDQEPGELYPMWSRTVAAALLDRYRRLLSGGLGATQPRYLWEYGWQHAALGGPSTLPALRALVELDDHLRVQLAHAERQVGEQLLAAGERTEAVPRLESAIVHFRQLTGHEREIADCLSNLGAAYRQVGRHTDAVAATQEALRLLHRLPDTAGDLAPQLSNIAVYLMELGEFDTAVATAALAVDGFRDTHAAIGLAMGLTNLGSARRAQGRPEIARPLLAEAVSLYRDQVTGSPDRTVGLASALNGLAGCLVDLGDFEGALRAAEEAVGLQPSPSAGLVKMWVNVASIRLALARQLDALAAARSGIDIGRRLVAGDRAYRAHLAMALTSHSRCALALGKAEEAAANAQEAVAIYRLSERSAYGIDLALTLGQLSRAQFARGTAEPALATVIEAVQLLRMAVTDNHPGGAAALVGTLLNAAFILQRLGRVKETIALLREALCLKPDHVSAWLDLAEQYRRLNHSEAAIAAAAEAVRLSQDAASPDLAHASAQAAREGPVPDTYRLEQLGQLDRFAQAEFHARARRQRAASIEEFDAEWRSLSGDEPPAWCRIDDDLFERARDWATALSVEAELAALQASPQLLTLDADPAVAEALLWTDAGDAEALAARRRAAMNAGTAAAYSPALQIARAHAFARADRATQLRQLDVADAVLSALAEEVPTTDAATAPHPLQVGRAMALVTAVNAGVDRALLSTGPATDPAQLAAGLLDRISEEWDATAWAAVARLAEEWAITPADRGRAGVANAIALAVAGEQDSAKDILAGSLATNDAERWALVGLCARVARWEPAVASLLASAANGVFATERATNERPRNG